MKKLELEKKADANLSKKGAKIETRKLDAPDFDSLFDGRGEDPILIDDNGQDPQEMVDGEISEALRRILEEKRLRMERYRSQVDSEFWFCVCFQNREQKEEFLKKAAWFDDGDKYLNGLEIARRMGIDITPVMLEVKKVGLPPKAMRNMETI